MFLTLAKAHTGVRQRLRRSRLTITTATACFVGRALTPRPTPPPPRSFTPLLKVINHQQRDIKRLSAQIDGDRYLLQAWRRSHDEQESKMLRLKPLPRLPPRPAPVIAAAAAGPRLHTTKALPPLPRLPPPAPLRPARPAARPPHVQSPPPRLRPRPLRLARKPLPASASLRALYVLPAAVPMEPPALAPVTVTVPVPPQAELPPSLRVGWRPAKRPACARAELDRSVRERTVAREMCMVGLLWVSGPDLTLPVPRIQFPECHW